MEVSTWGEMNVAKEAKGGITEQGRKVPVTESILGESGQFCYWIPIPKTPDGFFVMLHKILNQNGSF